MVREHFSSLWTWSGYTSVQFIAMVSLNFGTVCGHGWPPIQKFVANGQPIFQYSLWPWSAYTPVQFVAMVSLYSSTVCGHGQPILQYSLWP